MVTLVSVLLSCIVYLSWRYPRRFRAVYFGVVVWLKSSLVITMMLSLVLLMQFPEVTKNDFILFGAFARFVNTVDAFLYPSVDFGYWRYTGILELPPSYQVYGHPFLITLGLDLVFPNTAVNPPMLREWVFAVKPRASFEDVCIAFCEVIGVVVLRQCCPWLREGLYLNRLCPTPLLVKVGYWSFCLFVLVLYFIIRLLFLLRSAIVWLYRRFLDDLRDEFPYLFPPYIPDLPMFPVMKESSSSLRWWIELSVVIALIVLFFA